MGQNNYLRGDHEFEGTEQWVWRDQKSVLVSPVFISWSIKNTVTSLPVGPNSQVLNLGFIPLVFYLIGVGLLSQINCILVMQYNWSNIHIKRYGSHKQSYHLESPIQLNNYAGGGGCEEEFQNDGGGDEEEGKYDCQGAL